MKLTAMQRFRLKHPHYSRDYQRKHKDKAKAAEYMRKRRRIVYIFGIEVDPCVLHLL